MTEKEIAALVLDAFNNADDAPIKDVQTFRDAGIITDDTGFLVTLANGSEFTVTVSRWT